MVVFAVVGLAVAWYAFPFPKDRLEKWSTSPVVTDAKGREMLTLVGSDSQRRLPVPLARIAPWVVQATIAAEDKRFYSHAGVDFLAAGRAMTQNARAFRVRSGASTLDMQVCRMMDDRPRTVWAKAVESFRALQLDALESKDAILELYLNAAPYGGNLRGVEAAARAYFGKSAAHLSLAESALLAGLPQSPARYRPDRRPQAARARRNYVLERMAAEGMISREQCRQSQGDALVLAERPMGDRAYHAAMLALSRRPGGGQTTIDLDVQDATARGVSAHARAMGEDAQVAAVVIDIENAALVAMAGSGDPSDPVDGKVNAATAWRSPGSALKPFIYAAAMEAGLLDADTIVYDLAIRRAGWSPLNFDRTFNGPLPAGEALRRSLNVPAILVAEGVGLARCCGVLEAVGLRVPADTPGRTGLTLAVGGMDVTLLDLTNAYATLGRGGLRRPVRVFTDEQAPPVRALSEPTCGALSDILSSRRRRPRGMESLSADHVPWFAWKTGTSSGRRDAWAVGHNGRYAVGVWVGRFRGTGRVSFVGGQAAEPLLGEVFNLPGLRTELAPASRGPVTVRRPLGPPPEAAATLRIVSPSPAEVFVAPSGEAAIHPRVNLDVPVRWFLNGRLIAPPEGRVSLPPGGYELRCVAAGGQAAAVSFHVLPG
ncbi:MAG: penicillin-binding protein 1C [Planctomycetota bacterium]